MKNIILILLTAIVVSACEKTVTINIPDRPPKLVINALLEKGKTVTVNISKSHHILSPASISNDYAVTNAEAILYENGTAVDTLIYGANGKNYRSGRNIIVKEGSTYLIKVDAPGFTQSSAETIVPSQSSIAEVQRTKNARTNANGESFDEIILKLNDPVGEKNFYLVQFFGNGLNGTQGYAIGCVSTTDKDIEPIGNDADPTDPYSCYDGSSLLMKDINFNGREKVIKFGISSDQLMEHTSGNRVYKPYIKVSRITEDYFRFVKSYNLYYDSNENPFAEPVNVFTNVRNGYGTFTAYTAATVIIN